MLNNIALFISNIDVSSIYKSAGDIAKILSLSLTPVLLIIAIYVRILRDSLDTFSSGGSGMWARVVRDIGVYSIVISVYYALGDLIINFANDIYRWADNIGGLKLLTADMSEASKATTAKFEAQSVYQQILQPKFGGVLFLFTSFFYYLSLLLVAFLSAALKIAHALVFGFAFIWGLIAIPISVSQSIKLLRGWALLMGLALLWPLVQALLIALIRPTMIGALIALSNANLNVGVEEMADDLVLTVLNLIFAATLVAAPYLTSALVSNSPAAGAMVTPFVSAAMGGVAAAAGGARGGAKMASRSLGKDSASAVNTASAAVRGSFSSTSAGSSPSTAKEPGKPGAAASASSAASSPSAAERQQRRGVILSQNKAGKSSS